MHRTLLLALGGAALILAPGTTLAADLGSADRVLLAQASPGSPDTGGGKGSQSTGSGANAPSAMQPRGADRGADSMQDQTGGRNLGATSGKAAGAAASLEGLRVVNMQGDTIGEVADVQGDRVVISSGQYLGMGDRHVVVPRDRINVVGSGSAMRVQTDMSRDELMASPTVGGSGSSDFPRRGTGTVEPPKKSGTDR